MKANNQRKEPTNRGIRWQMLSLVLGSVGCQSSSAFVTPQSSSIVQPPTNYKTSSSSQLYHWANRLDKRFDESSSSSGDNDELLLTTKSNKQTKLRPLPEQFTRRSLLSIGITSTTFATFLSPLVANAGDFAPGGTLLDREVSIFYGNPEASPSRSPNNSNVLFNQDNYYKFGAAAQWIEPGSTDFPKTMPFVPSQQRYDNLKKYGSRVKTSMEIVTKIGEAGVTSAADVPEQTDPIYQLRALGLLANSFLASENTGTTNELMLARWYINEMYLRIGDYRDALAKGDGQGAKTSYGCLVKAMNSYLSLLNRQITSKVGDQFGYLT